MKIIKKFKKVNPDRVVSVSAILVSLATLIMILYQTNLMRKEQVSSVMPSLTIGYSVHENDSLISEKIWISNRGLGPAFIERIETEYNGQSFDLDPYGYLLENELNLKGEIITINRLYPGSVLPADDGLVLLEKSTDSSSAIVLSNTFQFPYDVKNMPSDKEQKVVIKITYRNVYGDEWIVSSDSSTPTPVED